MVMKIQRVIYTSNLCPSTSLCTTEDEDFQPNKDSVTNLIESWKKDISVYSEYLMSLRDSLHTIDTQGS